MKIHHKLGIAGGLIFLAWIAVLGVQWSYGQYVAAQNRYAISIFEQVRRAGAGNNLWLNTTCLPPIPGRTTSELLVLGGSSNADYEPTQTRYEQCLVNVASSKAGVAAVNAAISQIESLYTNQ